MLSKKTSILFLAAILIFSLAMCALAEGENSFDSGKQLFNQVREMYYSEKYDTAAMKDVLASSKVAFDQLSDGYDKNFWLAEVDYMSGLIADRESNKKDAEKFFDNAKTLVENAIKFDEKASEATRLLADVYAQLMNYKGFAFQVANGTKLKNLPVKAIEQDKKNYQAYVSLGIFYSSAPSYAGGSVSKAVQNLETALKSEDRSTQFIAYIWLATTYDKDKQRQMAINTIQKALEIYPDSLWAQQVLEEIKSK